MPKVIDILKSKKTFSFELFPPKTEQGYQNLLATIEKLTALKPDFISCTYGAGGGTRDKTLDIVELIQKKYHTTGVAHLTCVLHTKDEIKKILEDMTGRSINNVLALRGDPPLDNPNWQPGENNFHYSSDLCAFIRKNFGQNFSIGVAGFPEGHILSVNKDIDAKYLKQKIDNGADFVITQLFFDNGQYFDYMKRLKSLGVSAPVLPGILPIVDYPSLINFCKRCGTSIPDEVKKIFEPIQNDKEQTLKAGIDFAIKQCRALLNNGAPGIHFYCLNKTHPTDTILNAIRH